MKTVMLLINGFGVESKKSYSIYEAGLMPNLDKLINNYMFSPIGTNVTNYKDGYRNLMLGIREMYNYTVFEENMANNTFLNSPVLKSLKDDINSRKTKLHLFCLIDNSEKIVDQLKIFVKEINPNKDKKIYLHIVLTSSSYEDYPNILKILSKINIELSEFASIGLVLGLNSISNSTPLTDFNFFFRIMISEVTEKWQSFSQKLDVCYGIKQSPNMIKPFVVNNGFSLDKDDLFMFWNYDKIDLTNFISLCSNIKYGENSNTIKYYSLFEITSKNKVPFILTYHTASKTLAKSLEEFDNKALIMAKKEQLNIINYYANGLQNIVNKRVEFIEIDNYLFKPKELLNFINSYDHNLFIINYDIEEPKSVEELKTLLHNIDIMIGNIYENSKGSKYSLIVSSLYGINKIMKNQKGEICNIVFDGKVPFIYVDDFITRKNYLIEKGDISNIMDVCLKNLNKKYKGHSIIAKKNALYRLLFK